MFLSNDVPMSKSLGLIQFMEIFYSIRRLATASLKIFAHPTSADQTSHLVIRDEGMQAGMRRIAGAQELVLPAGSINEEVFEPLLAAIADGVAPDALADSHKESADLTRLKKTFRCLTRDDSVEPGGDLPRCGVEAGPFGQFVPLKPVDNRLAICRSEMKETRGQSA